MHMSLCLLVQICEFIVITSSTYYTEIRYEKGEL